MQSNMLFIAAIALSTGIHAETLKKPLPADSSKTVEIEDVVVVASPKENTQLRQTESSVTLFSSQTLKSEGVKTLSELSGNAPNLYMPAYGSAQTSAIYIRGIGSRINTPAVALYVDDVPVADKSAYNMYPTGINRIDILRGPQGTLYGRNAMGGIVRIYTDNPLTRQGVSLQTGTSSRDEATYLSAIINEKLNRQTAFSLGGYYRNSRGIYRNDTLGKKTGGGNEAGGKLRIVYRPGKTWNFDLNAAYQYTDQNAYPYFYGGTTGTTETLPGIVNTITANRESSYRRNMLTTAFKAEHKTRSFTAYSITSYQHMDDRMMMDQDFTYMDYYTLEQRQASNALTEELIVKSLPGKRLQWTGGLFGMWQNLYTQAPVTFYKDGIDMVNGILANALPAITYTNPMTQRPMTMVQSLALTDSKMALDSRMHTPVLNGAVFMQGTLRDFPARNIDFTLGTRLDYEHQEMDYTGNATGINFQYSMDMIRPAQLVSSPVLNGKLNDNYFRVLPKLALKYNLKNDHGNIYATMSKGHRSGGYNVQMMADVMRNAMQTDMTDVTRQYCNDLLQQQADNARTEQLRQMFLGIKTAMNNGMPQTTLPDVGTIVTYKPEYCWNYEAGTHLNFLNRTLTADFSFFFIDTHDQQIARFTNSGMGRAMVNAGQSHSCGLELSLRGNFLDDKLSVALNYGYTHAVFHKYDAGNGNDYTGNKVPFIPEHNTGAFIDYRLPLKHGLFEAVTFGINAKGFGRIYWTEANNAYQNFYATSGAHLQLETSRWQLDLWGKNLTQTKYHTFYFESMGKSFYQKGNPLQIGFDLSFKL